MLHSLPENNSLFSPAVRATSCVVSQTRAAQRRSFRKRGHRKLLFERCCTDELCMSPRSHQEGSGWLETRGFCGATGMALTESAQLFHHRLLASAFFTEAANTALYSREGSEQMLQPQRNFLRMLSHLLLRISQEAWPSWRGGGPATWSSCCCG